LKILTKGGAKVDPFLEGTFSAQKTKGGTGKEKQNVFRPVATGRGG